jgi:hypothetical protein
MKTWIPILALTSAGSIISNAANAQGYGLGVQSCAEFAQSLHGHQTIAGDLYFTWAQGFLSGLNLFSVRSTGAYRYIQGSESEMVAQKIRIRLYCGAHPQAQYAAAVMDLYASLPPRR